MSLLPPGVTTDDIDRVFGGDKVADEADLIAAESVKSFNECLTQRVSGYHVDRLEFEEPAIGRWLLRIDAPTQATLGKHHIEELSLALMAFAVALQMEAERS